MSVEVVLFYIYTPLGDHSALLELQQQFRAFATQKNLTGRLLLSTEGVNGTVAALPEYIADFKKEFVRLIPPASTMPWKVSTSKEEPFIDMKIQICKELVGWFGGEIFLRDSQIHQPLLTRYHLYDH